MDIRKRKELKALASSRLDGNAMAKKVLLIYTGLTLGLALVVTAANYGLDQQIGQTGGLGNMGTRATLSSLMQALPLFQSVLLLCLEVGYRAAMLRTSRGQYTSEQTLRLGFDRFWPLLRLSILRGLLLMAAAVGGVYLGTTLYLLTPLADLVLAMTAPLLENATVLDPNLLITSENYLQILDAMTPCFILCGIICVALVVPVWYRYRVSTYILIDKPAYGAIRCLRESRRMMRRNRAAFFRLDLSFWYYALAMALVAFLAYGDILLGLIGIDLTGNTAAFFGFYLLYLAGQAAVYYFLRNKMEVTFCLAYDSLRPKEPEETGAVLGNIFQM